MTPNQCVLLSSEERLGCYVQYIYYFVLSISGLVCLFAVVSGGVLFLISGTSVQMLKNAQERMLAGILGAVLLLSSYTILVFLNPSLLILGPIKPDIPDPIMPNIPSFEGQVPAYAEIPLGRLLERVKIVAGIANYWSYQTWYEGAEDSISGHVSLKEFTDCLKKLTDECDCSDIDTTNCPPGQCIGDPCDKARVTSCQDIDLPANLRDSMNVLIQKIPEKNDEFLEVKATTQAAKEALEYANSRLKVAEGLIRDSITPALNYDSFIALEDKEIRKLWIYEDMPIEEKIDPSGLPVPPQECSSDAPYEIVPSCTICGNVLFCYGNNYRLCDTDPAIPVPNQENTNSWLDPSTFPSGTVLYNGAVFPVPLGGVHVCGSNVYGCANNACSSQGLSESKDDPATFYITVDGNQDIISDVENLLMAPPPMIPPDAPLPPDGDNPYPPGTPPPVTHDLQQIAMWVQEKTGVRAALILAMLYHESGLAQFPGSGNYPNSFCCSRSSWWQTNNCNKFEDIWKGLTGSINGIYSGTRLDGTPFSYTMYNVPVSAAGYIGGVYNCGGAMGPAQAMAFSWLQYAAEVKLITGKSAVSPWNYTDAFVFAAIHMKKRGGADSQKCENERTAVCNYWGDTGCRNYNSYATSVLQRANGITEHKTSIGAAGNWTMCNGGVPPPPPGGEWKWPIHDQTVLSSDGPMHINRGSVCAWDWTAGCGTKIYPAKAGTVKYAGCNNAGGYGCWVIVDHGAGWKTYYCHMRGSSGVYVSYGQYVTTETALGVIGCTGYTSFGPHTHFEVFGPYSSPGCKGRVDPTRIFGSPASIGLKKSNFCVSGGCPACLQNLSGYSCF